MSRAAQIVFMARLDDVFIEKRVARFCVLETVPETIFLIWRCQTKLKGPRELGNIVNGSLDEFCGLGMDGEIASIIGTARWISVTSRFPDTQQVGAPTVPGRS